MTRRKAAVSWRDTDKRMRRAVQLRQQGLSQRQIADQLAVSHTTIQRDLARWEALEVDQLLAHMAGTYDPENSRMCQPNVPPKKPKTPNPNDRRMR